MYINDDTMTYKYHHHHQQQNLPRLCGHGPSAPSRFSSGGRELLDRDNALQLSTPRGAPGAEVSGNGDCAVFCATAPEPWKIGAMKSMKWG
jgi:hypothetical protein